MNAEVLPQRRQRQREERQRHRQARQRPEPVPSQVAAPQRDARSRANRQHREVGAEENPGRYRSRTGTMNAVKGIARDAVRQIAPRHPRHSNGRATRSEIVDNHRRVAVSELRSSLESASPVRQAKPPDTNKEANHNTRSPVPRAAPHEAGSNEDHRSAA